MLEPALSQKEQGAGESSCLSMFASEALVLRVTFEPIGLLRVEEAAQWTLAHQGGNFNATTAPPLRRVLFLRGGRQWKNVLNFNLGGITASEVQLSFRDNAASSGNFTGSASGSIPVIKWTGPAAGTLLFELALKQYGRFNMAVKVTDTLGNHSMFEMEWIVVP
jgi:hypothetical protein